MPLSQEKRFTFPQEFRVGGFVFKKLDTLSYQMNDDGSPSRCYRINNGKWCDAPAEGLIETIINHFRAQRKK